MKIYDIKWTSESAGPSPDSNKRTEVFLFGCKKALDNPCEGCFNPTLWDNSACNKEYSPDNVVDTINKFAPNKFITFVGGEPLDQLSDLATVCRGLKKADFHIIVFTHYELVALKRRYKSNKDLHTLLNNIDILIDGEYDRNQRIYRDNFGDGFFDAVGSGNQVIWDLSGGHSKIIEGLAAKDLAGIYVTPRYELKYITKSDKYVQRQLVLEKKVS